jgi:protein TonB
MESTFDNALGSTTGRKSSVLAVVILLHIVLVYALVKELGIIRVDLPPPPIIADIIEQIEEVDEPPPPPPTIETPPPYVPPPDLLIDVPTDAPATTALTAVTNVKQPPAPPPAPVVRVAPTMDKRFARRFQPDYPPTSQRLGEEGRVTIQCVVNTEGKCIEAKVIQSSGFPRLDEAALKHAPRAWKFNPGTEDGKPVTSPVTVPVRFQITK